MRWSANRGDRRRGRGRCRCSQADVRPLARPLEDVLHELRAIPAPFEHRTEVNEREVHPRVADVPEDRWVFGHIIAEVLELVLDRKSTRLNSSHQKISYAVF